MRAAIYARVSTDDQGASIEAQVADARRFAESRGWSVAAEAVYRDEGLSGADFITRPSLLRMLAEVARAPRPWDVLVMRDVDRLGRDQAQTVIAVERIISKGARLFVYNGAREVSLSPMEKAMLGMQAVFGEFERAMIVDRVRGSHEYRARRGLATGGSSYGYRNVRREDGFADFAVDPVEAEVVREIYGWRADGRGPREIARTLNARGTPSPWAGKRGTRSWAPSEVIHILASERYRGVLAWGRTRKGYAEGRKVVRPQDESAVVRVERPDLRIVDDDLWQRAQEPARAPSERVRRGRAPRYLLTGFARCARCDGPIVVSNKKHGDENVRAYLCSRARDRGPTVCTVKLRRPVESMDEAVVGWLRSNLLNESFVELVLAEVRAQLESRAAGPDPRDALRAELRRVEAEVERLTDAVARGAGAVDALVRAVAEREARARSIRAEIEAAGAAAPVLSRWGDVEARSRRRIADLSGMLGRNLDEGRAVLRALLATPLRCSVVTVEGKRRFKLTGLTRIPLALDVEEGAAATVRQEVSPAGVEPALAT